MSKIGKIIKKCSIFFSILWGKIRSIKNPGWYALAISVVGGVPGIIAASNWFNHKPKFGFYSATMVGVDRPMKMRFGMNAERTVNHVYILIGVLYNDGDLPLFPIQYNLGLKFKDEESETTFPAITVSFRELVKGNLVEDKPNKLMEGLDVTTIAPQEAKWVYFAFEDKDNLVRPFSELKQSYLYTMDVFRKVRKFPLVFVDNNDSNHYYYNPILGQGIIDSIAIKDAILNHDSTKSKN